MSSIFHYTDTVGAVGIINSRSLFASDLRYLNDYSEGALIDSLLVPRFRDEVKTLTRELIDAGLVDKNYYAEMGPDPDGDRVGEIFKLMPELMNFAYSSFVVSFCRHQKGSQAFEHGLLSQWRGYAGRSGFALEFDEDGLASLLKLEGDRYFFVTSAIRDVIYGDFGSVFNQDDYPGLARKIAGTLFADKKLTPKLDLTQRVRIENISEVDIKRSMVSYLSTAPFLKDSGFDEECEHRISIVSLRNRNLVRENAPEKLAKPVEFRTRGNLILPYIRLFHEVAKKLPVKAVIVGPHPNQGLQSEAIERLLDAHEYSVPVRRSKIPFRD